MANESRVIITADSAQAIREFNRLRTQSTSSLRDIASYSDKVGAALGAIGMGTGLAAIVGMSDEYTKFTAQLRLATVSQNEYNAAYADVKRIATGSQQSLAGTGTLYARIANGTRELGTTQKQVADITETVNLALKVSGATATESASAQLQLSQAFASGTLRGEEFNAVNEAAPRLMKALADGMGLPIGALKGLAGEGKITSQIMAEVLPKALGALQEEGKKIATIGGALTVLKDEFMELTAIKAQDNGTVSALTTGIRLLTDNMAILMGTITTLTAAKLGSWMGKWVTDTYAATVANKAAAASSLALAVTTSEASAIAAAAKLTEARATSTVTGAAAALATARVAELRTAVAAAQGEVMLASALNGLIPAEARATALAEAHAVALAAETAAATAATRATTAATVALSAQAAAATLATRAMGVLRGIMAFMGGPIGTIITLLGAAAIAWSHYSNKAKEANADTAESLEEASVRINAALDKRIEKYQAIIDLRDKGVGKSEAKAYASEYAQLAALERRREAYERGTRGTSSSTAMILLLDIDKEIAGIRGKIATETKKSAEAELLLGTQAYEVFKKTYGTKQEQRAGEIAAIDAAKMSAKEYADILGRINSKYADKGAASALKKEESAYKSLMTSIQEKLEANKLEALGYESMTDAQKMTVKLNAAILADNTKLSTGDIERARQKIALVAAEDAQLLSTKNVKNAMQELKDSRDKDAASAYEEIEANKLAIATYGMTKAQIEELTLARMEDRLARRGPQDLDLDEAEVNHLMRMIGLQKEKTATARTLGELDTGSSVAKAKELLDILTAVDAATKSAADGMAASFGKVGSAIGGLTTALSGYAVQQQAIAAQLATVKADPKSSAEAIAKAEIAATRGSAQAKIKSYGDMAGAAKGFFKENTVGYKVMESTEKAFRAYEMAMAVESMVKKIFFKEAEVAANLTLNATKLTGEATTTAASTGLAATEASAWGITAVVKALASLPFPMNLAAGAATLAAVVAIGAKMFGSAGGGSASVSEQRQAANGTGTVLGDPTAKSESIAKSLSLIADNTFRDLAISSGMLSALRNIESGIGGLGGLLAQTPGVTSVASGNSAGAAAGLAKNMVSGPLAIVLGGVYGVISTVLDKVTGGFVSRITGSIANSIFGGKVTALDTGITANKMTLGQVGAGRLSVGQYTDIKKDGGIFSKDKYSSPVTALGAEMDDQFTKIVLGLRDTIVSAASVLGAGGDSFAARLNTFVVDLGKISFKGLDAAAQQKALEAAFSKMGDKMAEAGVAGLQSFRAVGEGYLETLVRVANDYATIDAVLGSFNKTFGAVGISSIAAREELLKMSGGLDKFTSQGAFFLENFFTDKEKADTLRKSVNTVLTPLNKGADITTVEEFKKLALAQDLTTESGQKTYTSMMAVSQAFIELTRYGDEFGVVAKTASEIDSERKDLQKQLNELTKTEAQLLAIQRDGLAAVNRALFDQIQAAKAVTSAKDALGKAYDREAAAAQTALDKSKSWVTTLNGLNASMALGSQSVLTPEQKYAEARAQFEKTLAAANAGDTTAQSGLSAAEQAFLTASQVVNASDAKYAADYARVIAANEAAAKWASAQVDVQQASLDALKAQVSGLITINDSVLTVAQAIANLRTAMGTATGLGVKFDGSHAGGLTNVPFDGYAAELHRGEVVVDAQAAAAMRRYFGGTPSQGGGNNDALVAEIKLLRAEVAAHRADQDKQTGATIQATVESSDKAAKTVVAGVDKSAKGSAWANTVKGEYA